ncbi:MAG: hypothetical protein MJ239_03690 [Bacilli bacterium]|nr:hypothetical protein [Bacilli bacterium]
MKEYHSKGTICTTGPFGIECAICTIEYIEREDDTFCYIFTPNYSVMDLLGYEYFDGIPGLDLDLRKERYIRENFVPSFISERVPQKNRVDYIKLLKKAGLEMMEPIEYLIRVGARYFGDEYYVARYREKEIISFSEIGKKKNLQGTIKEALERLYHGDDIYFEDLLINDLNREYGVKILSSLLNKYKEVFMRNQLLGVEEGKKKGSYKGRKPLEVDIEAYFSALEEVKEKKITPKEAAEKVGISIDKYYRLKKKYGE